MTKLERKLLAILLAELILFAQIIPPPAMAGTGGPAQPEFSTFESVGTSDMVNEFTGSFTWNLPVIEVPGPNGSGYAMSLSYHSGTSPNEPASWVGYGWTLNPGSVSRNVRGFPDDYKQDTVTYYNKTPKNWTVTAGTYAGVEAYSIGLSVNASIRYNNYMGYGYSAGVGLSAAGMLNLNYGISDGEGSFSASIRPPVNMKKKWEGENGGSVTVGAKMPAIDIVGGRHGFIHGEYGMASFGTAPRPGNFPGYTGKSYNVNTSLQGSPSMLEIGLEGGLIGNYNYQNNDATETPEVYGYLYSADPDISDSDVMDYSSERERPFTKHDYYLHTSYSNADNFILNGEGLSGSFRLYNKKPGHFRPSSEYSSTDIYQLGFGFHMLQIIDFSLSFFNNAQVVFIGSEVTGFIVHAVERASPVVPGACTLFVACCSVNLVVAKLHPSPKVII